MKLNVLLKPWRGDKRFTAIAKYAAALKKSGSKDLQIVAQVEAEFGKPTELARINEQPQPYKAYGQIGVDIEAAALEQLLLALRLPIAAQGALMPDAHPGFALPIGGVFAAHNAVSPMMVGVDIGCRMHLTIFAEAPMEIQRQREQLFRDLADVTVFGSGASRKRGPDHPILGIKHWNITAQTRSLREKAIAQLGTSGGGNHFANIVVGERIGENDLPRQFVGLLTHSGSRGVGYAIAKHYSNIAVQETARQANVPKMYEWLDLDSEAGQEYWAAMELAGAFAQANHEVIHRLFAQRTKLQPIATIQNHHNFAWREGDLIVHRKGATPAGVGVRGVIPGSMASASYVVEGLGNPEALHSASHGAGRLFSRSKARATISPSEAKKVIKAHGVHVEGWSVDESPLAYKDIERVMELQIEADLIKPLARMKPIAVIMAGEAGEN